MNLLDVAVEIADSYRKSNYAAETIHLQVRAFEFSCNPKSGDVKHIPAVSDGITIKLGDTVSASYAYFIQQALSLASKIDLIERLAGLRDPAVNAIISKAGTPLDEKNVQQVLGQLVNHSILGQGGFFSHQPSLTQNIIREELSRVGPNNIHTYTQTEELWTNISTRAAIPQRPQGPVQS